MTAPVLLAVIEVPYEERVRCAADGCGHSVFRRVHLVRAGGPTKVYGSDCFTRLFGSTPTGQAAPKYGSGSGRILTPEERALLTENTERLIEQFEREHQAQIAEAERRHALLESRQALPRAPSPILQQVQQASQLVARPPRPTTPSPAQRAEAEARARKALGDRFPGVNLDLPGFKGLVNMEAEKILHENAGVGMR